MSGDPESNYAVVVRLLRQVIKRIEATEARLGAIEAQLGDIPDASDFETAAEMGTEIYFERLEILLHSLGASFPEEPRTGPRPVPDPPPDKAA